MDHQVEGHSQLT